MNKEEIENRIEICEERANAYREVGNVKSSNKYENEKYKWEKLLNQLNPKMEKELNEYRRGYYKQKEVIDKAIDKLYSIPIETTRQEVIDIARETLHILKEV